MPTLSKGWVIAELLGTSVQTSWKFVVPLCLAGGLCLVLYASFEASEDDRPLSSDDPSLKRMQPFLSSQSFEIGLWTRQKPTGDETSTAPDMSRSSAEVERLRQQLLLERSRIAEQSAEIARLRGSVTPQPAQTVQDFDPTVHIAADTKESDASIPDSLWREPPLLDKEATSSSRLEKDIAAVLDELHQAKTQKVGGFEAFGSQTSGMSKHMFTAAVSEKVRKLSAMASEVTPIVRRRRLSLPTSWSGTSTQELHDLTHLNHLKPPRLEASQHSIETASSSEGVEELILPADIPGTVQEVPAPQASQPVIDETPLAVIKDGSACESIPRTLSKKDAKWVQGLDREDAKLNLFERKTEPVDMVGRGMGLVAGADDFHVKVFRSAFHRRCYNIATSSSFEIMTILLICSSALQIGFSTNDMAERLVTETASGHRILEVIYCIVFSLELSVRLVAHRLDFFTQVGWAWNVFDLLLVGFQLVEELLLALSGPDPRGPLQQVSPTTLLRIARILRAVRVLRVLRIALMASDLRLLVSCLLYCSRPFFWTFVLLGLMLYIAGIYITQLLLFYRVESQQGHELEAFFGSVPRSMLSLFEAMTGGVDWDVLVAPLFDLSAVVGVGLVSFFAFAIVGVLNVVTGTFVQSAIVRAEEVKDVQRAMKARKLFRTLDDNQSGQISYNEILNHTKDHSVQDFFKDLDIEPSEAKFLFDMLDVNQSGSIDFEEFLNGCIRLQGPAKAIDMLVVTRETRMVYDNLTQNLQHLRAELTVLSERLLGQWNYDDSPPQTGGSTREALKAVEKENTITVKAGDREIVLQISKPETTLEPPSHRPGSEVLETSFVAAQTFNGSGVKHTLDSVNRTRSTALPNVSSSDREHSLLQSATQHRNGTAKNKDREKENDGSQIVQEQLGLKANSESDSEALRASFLFNIGLISAYLVLFVVFQRWKPLVYLHNTTIQKAPEPHPSWFGVWLSSEEVEEYAGLDSALMIEFCNLGMKICIYLGIPLTVVCLPVFYVMGKHPGPNAGICTSTVQFVPRSSLDLFSISSLRCNGLAMRWILAATTWIIVWAVQRLLRQAQKRLGCIEYLRKFVERRVAWLQQRPKPQSSTILVTNIPPSYRSDAKLKEYFDYLFPGGIVERDPDKRPTIKVLQDAEAVDSIDHYTKLVEHLQRHIEGERDQIRQADSFDEAEYSGAAAFVTFKASRDAEMALRLRLEPEGHLFTMEYPPIPKDVSYEDLLRSPFQRQMLYLLGYALIFMVFLFFFPLIGAASSIVNLENLERIDFVHRMITSSTWVQSVMEGIFATLLLSVFMAFLPSTLHVIIASTFTLNSKAQSQLFLQQWYFWFQVIFVLLVTAIGTSLWQRFADVLTSPTSVVLDLAGSLPNTSTFYMSYIILQWSVSVLNILRYQNLLKFFAWTAVSEEARAKELSEPEDPDYYGIGSRSARLNVVLAIALVFSLVAPIALWCGFVYFLINRLVFSYLVVFAETAKPDLGGYFWAQQLRHVQLTLPIFVVVMSGCLWTKPYGGPGIFALLSLAEVGNSTQQVLASPRSNFSDSVSDASGPPSGPPSGRDSEKSATQITVRSGQQSIVIQVRDGSEEVRLPPRAEDKELSLNNTSGAPMVLPEVETAKAVPELPEPSALPQDTTLSLSPEGPGPSLRGVQGIQGAPERSLPEEEAATTTKGYSAYANLAFRTR
eukprot:s2947_g6.t4